MDKYEEFKNWFKEQTDISWRATGCHFVDYDDDLPFSKFEHEQEEKQKEEDIKKIILSEFHKPVEVTYSNGETTVNYDYGQNAENIIKKLKGAGYLK